jgi:hypothetical protein
MVGNDVTLRVGFDIDKFNAELSKTNGILDSWGKKVTGMFAGYFSFQIAKDIGKQMVDITAQFQRFGAILGNTLGSDSKAQKALEEIRKFAIATPFEVSEITAAYVRWANMGLDPTIEKMGKLGDVASSLGAGFEQTAEAFKDLMVGQTKRLEEIGISAEAIRGTNQLKLSFKGVTIEIEKNAAGVQKALDIYSQLNGVLGTSNIISKTLGGQISNLSDAWSNFLLSVGNSSSGAMSSIVVGLTNFLNGLSRPTAEATKGVSWWEKALEALGIATQKVVKANQGLARGSQSTWEEVSSNTKKATQTAEEYRQKILEQVKAYEKLREAHFASVKALDTRYVKDGQLKDSGNLGNPMSQVAWSQQGTTAGLPGKVGAPMDIEKWIAYNNKLAEQAKTSQQYITDITNKYKEITNVVINTGSLLGEGLMIIADAMYASMTGTMSFGKAILKGLAAFMKQFGQQLIVMGAGAIALEYLSVNPYVAIAAGLALTAAAAAVSNSLSDNATTAMKGGSSSGGNTRPGVSGATQSEQRLIIQMTAKGSDLVAVYDSAQADNRIRKGR